MTVPDRGRAARVADDAVGDAAADVAAQAGLLGEAEQEGPGDAGPGAVAPESVPGEVPSILPDAAALAAERDEYLHALQRLKADFDNYRKRVARLEEERAARAAGDLVRKLLPALDNLDLAIAHLGAGVHGGGAEASEEARALDQARRQLLETLAKEGLERVDAAGVPFDPTVHDAVAAAPGPDSAQDAPDGSTDSDDPAAPAAEPGGASVDEVLRAGYRWRGQVLRPAMVRVRS